MKKMSLFAIATVALMAFALMPATSFADGCQKAAKTTAKSECTSKTDATQANAKDNCDPAACAAMAAAGKCDPAACASKPTSASATTEAKATMVGSASGCSASKGVSATTASADDADMAGYTLVSMNVSGMTCGGCEKSVTAALEQVDGVVKVKKVCSSSGVALVYVDAAKMKDNTVLTKAIANKGFSAEVVPAVSKTSSEASMTKTGADACSKTCTAAEKAACSATKKTAETKMTAAGTN